MTAAYPATKLLTALKTVSLPGDSMDVVARGLVTVLEDEDPKVRFMIDLTQQDQSLTEKELIHLKTHAEAAAKSIGFTNPVCLILQKKKGVGTPSSPPHTKHPIQKLPLPQFKYIIAVASGKGGVGKSTIAVNLALAFSHLGLKVGLLDADIYGPSIPKLLNIRESATVKEGKIKPFNVYNITCMSIGFLIEETQAVIWRGLMVQRAVTQFLCDVDWPPLDILVIDMPPGTGDVQLTVAQKVHLTGAVVVSTPQDLALLDAKKAVTMFEKTGVPLLGMVENMSYFACPHCHQETPIFNQGQVATYAKKMGLPLLGSLPLDIAIRESGDQGQPITLTKHEAAFIFEKMAKTLWEKISS